MHMGVKVFTSSIAKFLHVCAIGTQQFEGQQTHARRPRLVSSSGRTISARAQARVSRRDAIEACQDDAGIQKDFSRYGRGVARRTRHMRGRTTLIASLWLSSAAWSAQAAEPDASAESGSAEKATLSQFSLFEEYRLRIASHALPSVGPLGEAPRSNQQTDQHLRLLGDGSLSAAEDHFRAEMSGALWLDLDGGSAPGAASLFATQYDNARPWIAAYQLSAEWRRDKMLDHARVGRQASEHGMPVTFDGGSLGLRILDRRLLLFGFGGRTVHFFETKPGLFENWLASVGANYRPSEELAFEIDARIIQEQVLDIERSRRDTVSTASYGLSGAWHTENLYTKVFARGIDSRASHVGGNFQFQDTDLGLGLDARVHAQLVTLAEIAESENPFFSLLGPSLPHARFRFESWKDLPLGKDASLSLHLGWRGRQVIAHPEQAFNRNTGAVYLNTRIDNIVQRGLFLGGTAEGNYVPRALTREWVLAFGGYAGYFGDNVRTEVGTYFQQFKINYYQVAEELHNARTVYGSVSYRLLTWLDLRARYEIDIFDRYLQSFYLSARQDF